MTENKQQIVCVIMGQNCEKFIGMCLKSVIDADRIIFCDGGSKDDTIPYLAMNGFCLFSEGKMFKGNKIIRIKDNITKKLPVNENFIIIQNEYNQDDKGMNGKQRNFYLKYVQEHYKNYWCLILDADEVVEDFSKIRNFIDTIPKEHHDILFSIKL